MTANCFFFRIRQRLGGIQEDNNVSYNKKDKVQPSLLSFIDKIGQKGTNSRPENLLPCEGLQCWPNVVQVVLPTILVIFIDVFLH